MGEKYEEVITLACEILSEKDPEGLTLLLIALCIETEKILTNAVNIQAKLDAKGLTGNAAVDFIDNNRQLIAPLIPCGAAVWLKLPHEAKVAFLQFISDSVKNISHLSIVTANESIGGIIAKISHLSKYGKIVSITLAAIPIIYETLRSVYLWWKGEISGARAAQSVVNTTVSAIAGYGGAIGGAMLGGAIAGPIGAVVGGFAGGIGAGIAANAIITLITQELFDLPKSEALEKAYLYLNVHHRASDADVAAAYKKRSLIDHPDKGGSSEAFCKLQACISIIRVARGEVIV
uniref:J domain-containing protein n=1 Tax=Panagrolaimus sp. ES5 TaxID=591445 RepID=A0AC34FSY7_9BILA